jgi:hypothetical protein
MSYIGYMRYMSCMGYISYKGYTGCMVGNVGGAPCNYVTM